MPQFIVENIWKIIGSIGITSMLAFAFYAGTMHGDVRSNTRRIETLERIVQQQEQIPVVANEVQGLKERVASLESKIDRLLTRSARQD